MSLQDLQREIQIFNINRQKYSSKNEYFVIGLDDFINNVNAFISPPVLTQITNKFGQLVTVLGGAVLNNPITSVIAIGGVLTAVGVLYNKQFAKTNNLTKQIEKMNNKLSTVSEDLQKTTDNPEKEKLQKKLQKLEQNKNNIIVEAKKEFKQIEQEIKKIEIQEEEQNKNNIIVEAQKEIKKIEIQEEVPWYVYGTMTVLTIIFLLCIYLIFLKQNKKY